MTAPRPVVPGRDHFVTRRTAEQRFFLLPVEEVTNIFEYCLAEAAQRFEITLYGWLVMSNHYHLALRDNRGNYPDFLCHLHKNIAKAVNAHWRRRENMWSSEQVNVVWLLTPEDVFREMVYTLANPVASDLVERVAEWPGTSSFELYAKGGSKTVPRPAYFRDDGPMPETLTLSVDRPTGYAHLSEQDWVAKIQNAVLEEELFNRRRRRRDRIKPLGRRGILRTSPFARPKKPQRRASPLKPTLACADGTLREAARAGLKDFRKRHRAALNRLIEGQRGVVFPFGTFRVRKFGVRCEPNPNGERTAA